jgi:hypothetical protein
LARKLDLVRLASSASSSRAARFLAARRQFLKQPRVFDGEHGLVGKGLQ